MDEQQLRQQIVQLVQAAMQGDQQATQQIQQIMQAAQQGDPQAAQIAQMIQAVAQQMQQQQVRAAKFGAKLNYIRQLRGQCPEGYEMQYYKSGGQLCKRCMKKQDGGEVMQAPRNIKEQFQSAKCGTKMKKKACGGAKLPAHQGGTGKQGVKLLKETKTGEYPEPYTVTRHWSDGTTSTMTGDESGLSFTGRRGEVGITNVPNDRQNAIADSLERADWTRRTVPALPSTKKPLKRK